MLGYSITTYNNTMFLVYVVDMTIQLNRDYIGYMHER
jgi:hypothetical protein